MLDQTLGPRTLGSRPFFFLFLAMPLSGGWTGGLVVRPPSSSSALHVMSPVLPDFEVRVPGSLAFWVRSRVVGFQRF